MQKRNQMRKSSIIIIGLLVTVFILIGYLVLQGSDEVIVPFDETPLRKEIHEKDSLLTVYQDEAATWHNIAQTAINTADSLSHLTPEIKHHYHEIYKFNSTASNSQLDSVIRANW